MEICTAPTLRLKALTSMTHIMYIKMEKIYQQFNRKVTHNVDINKDSSITM